MNIQLETKSPLFPDLVRNIDVFKEKYVNVTGIFKAWNKINEVLKDNSDYSHIVHIDDLLKNITESDMQKSHLVRVPIDYIFSSEKEKGGYDRPYDANTKNVDTNFRILRTPNGNGEPKGFKEEDAGVLQGILRPCGDKWQLVKFIGNNRVFMKLIANEGEVTDIKMEIRFHETNLSDREMLRLESERHTTDAGDRSGQNEGQKFASSLRADRSWATYCFNFLKDNKLNYQGIMEIEGVEGCDDFLNLTAISGIKDGEGNGFFKNFGLKNVEWAAKTARSIAKITGEKSIGMSPIEALSVMFKTFTTYGEQKNGKPYFTHDELSEFFIEFYEYYNNQTSRLVSKKSTHKLKNLNASGGLKCMIYVCANTFWPELPSFHQDIRGKKTTFADNNEAIKYFIGQSKDALLRKEIRKIVQ